VKFKAKCIGTVFTAHAMKTCGFVEVQHLPLFNYTLNGGEWLASLRGCFSDGESLSKRYWVWGWFDSREGLDTSEHRRNFWPCRESNRDPSDVQRVV